LTIMVACFRICTLHSIILCYRLVCDLQFFTVQFFASVLYVFWIFLIVHFFASVLYVIWGFFNAIAVAYHMVDALVVGRRLYFLFVISTIGVSSRLVTFLRNISSSRRGSYTVFGTFLHMCLPDSGRKFLTRCVECFALFIYDNIFLLNRRLFNRFINIIHTLLR
jgi:hypothetical protein